MPDGFGQLMAQGQPYIEKYGLIVLGGALFAETCFFTGFWFPGVAILVSAGFAAASGMIPVGPAILIALVGAILGDQASYFAGRFLGQKWSRRHGKLASLLQRALEQEGSFLLIAYHYASYLRAILPYVAGSCRYDLRRWLIFDSLGVSIWALLYFGMGYLGQGALRGHGSLLVRGFSVLALILVTVISWRLGSRFLKLRREAAEPEAA